MKFTNQPPLEISKKEILLKVFEYFVAATKPYYYAILFTDIHSKSEYCFVIAPTIICIY